MSSKEIKDLVRSAQKGDAEAFGALYEKCAKDLYRFALYQTGSDTRAEDAVSDAVLRAFENIRRLEKAESFRAWMFSILRNCCREQQKEKYLALQTVELTEQEEHLGAEPDFAGNAALKAALRELDEGERELVLLSVLGGYNSKELAAMTGAKPATVRSRLARAKARLQSRIA